MPKKLERKLKKETKGMSKERADAYVYGTLAKIKKLKKKGKK
jgi:hypothetical protein